MEEVKIEASGESKNDRQVGWKTWKGMHMSEKATITPKCQCQSKLQ